jgi:virginiamycin B lyase
MTIFAAVCALRCAAGSGCELPEESALHEGGGRGRGWARRAALGLLLGVVAAAVCVSIAVAAGPEIYWANDSNNTIGRASADGANRDERFISTGTDGPADVFVYGQHIYWANATGGCSESGACDGTIAVANLNGTDVNKDLVSAVTPYGLAVQGNYIYWSNFGTGTIGRATIKGTDVNQKFITGGSGTDGIAVNSRYIYWANNGSNTIGRANLNGTGVNQGFIVGVGGPEGMAIDSQFIYWANHGGASIGRAALNGTELDYDWIPAGAWPTRVTVDAEHVYWTTWAQNGVPTTGTIGEANIDGTGIKNDLISSTNSPVGVALSGVSLSGGPASGPVNLISNGNFGGPLVSDGLEGIQAGASGTSSLPGWTVGGGGVDVYSRAYWTPSSAAGQSLQLYDSKPGSVSQTVATVPGKNYLLQWEMAGNPGSQPAVKTINVMWDGKVVDSPSFNVTGRTGTNMGWTPGSVKVTATGMSSTVEFADATVNGTSYSSAVDAVSLTLVAG